jgi:adenylate cyclase
MKPSETIDIARWIVDSGLVGAAQFKLLEGVCERMVTAGVPLMRAYIAQPTLHPVIAAHGYEWRRDAEGATQEAFDRPAADVPSKTWQRSPFFHMHSTETHSLRLRLDTSNEPLEFPMLDELKEMGATDYLAKATAFREEAAPGAPIAGMMSSWTSDRPGGFDDDDVAAIEILLPVLALAIKAETTAGIAHSVVETYLGRDAGHRVLSGEIGRGSVETIRAVLWLCDLQGFTKIADSTPRDELIPMLNDYFEAMVDTVHEHGGQVLKFMGDGLLAILNLDGGEDDQVCAGALDAAEEALARVDEVNQRRADEGLPVTEFSLALHLGEVLYGNVGSRDRLDFTVVGPAVNEVSRIEAMCRSLDQNLIISSTFAHAAMGCSERLISLGRYALRGVRRPQELYTLLSREDAEEADILEAGSLAAS